MESMTGFGSFSGQERASWTWTLRSVNSKGLEIRCRYPQGYEDLEQKIRECLRSFFTRGSIYVSLDLTFDLMQQKPRINIPFLEELCLLSQQLQQQYPRLQPARIDGLINVRGVAEINPDFEEDHDEMRVLFLSSLGNAAEALKKARLAEGEKITACLNDQVNQIEALITEARSQAAVQPEYIKKRLKEGLALIKEDSELSEERFMQEVTACMLRADVREELDRLTAHVHTARELFTEKGPVGRKLDFLCQEFNREANTLCSKSADIELTRIGMALKTVIDQLREQIQNIE
ncbi:MAG: YicC family protein [Alphaproteobacteria bacterium]|nr:YicC family protein [Alphaproteobacteria bacterium]